MTMQMHNLRHRTLFRILHVCMHIYIHIHMYKTYSYMQAYIYIYTSMYLYAYSHVYVLHMCLCICIYTCINTCIQIYTLCVNFENYIALKCLMQTQRHLTVENNSVYCNGAFLKLFYAIYIMLCCITLYYVNCYYFLGILTVLLIIYFDFQLIVIILLNQLSICFDCWIIVVISYLIFSNCLWNCND